MVLCVIVPLVWISSKKSIKESFSKGKWKKMPPESLGFYLLTITAAGAWVWAISNVLKTPLPFPRFPLIFFLVALFKAALTGGGEELGYRGFILRAAVKRFGVFAGIFFQAVLYTAFHIKLTPAFFSPGVFLLSVFTMGLILGYVSHKTGGIGWAFLIHFGIDVVIEWQNIC